MVDKRGTVPDMSTTDVERRRRQRRMARLRSNAGGFHRNKRRELRAEVKRKLKENRGDD